MSGLRSISSNIQASEVSLGKAPAGVDGGALAFVTVKHVG